jgi:hypothetical protein
MSLAPAARLQAAAPVVEAFTDYAAFRKALGAHAQVVTFDDVPTFAYPGEDPSDPNRFGSFEVNHYAPEGILIRGTVGRGIDFPDYGQGVFSSPFNGAISPPNVYFSSFLGLGVREFSDLRFTRDGHAALTSAFGTYFLNNYNPGQPPGSPNSLSLLSAYGVDGSLLFEERPEVTAQGGSTFLGFATVDSATGRLVPAIREITVSAGEHDNVDVFLDNFTFGAPVPEANGWVLLGATVLGAVGITRLRRSPGR